MSEENLKNNENKELESDNKDRNLKGYNSNDNNEENQKEHNKENQHMHDNSCSCGH